MNLLARFSVQKKLVIVTGGILFAIGFFVFMFFPARQHAGMVRDLTDKTVVIGQIVAQGVATSVLFDDAGAAQSSLEALPRLDGVAFGLVLRSDGSTLAAYQAERAGSVTVPSNDDAKRDSAVVLDTPEMTIACTPVMSGKNRIGSVIVGMEKSGVDRETASNRWIALAVSLVLFAAGLGVLWYLTRRFVTLPVQEVVGAAERISMGETDVVLTPRAQDELGTLATALNAMARNLADQASAAGRIAAGDLSDPPRPRSEKDTLGNAMVGVHATLRDVVAELTALTHAASEGDLSVRGRYGAFAGAYQDIVKGMNDTLDAVIDPMKMAAACVDRIARGDIPEPITAEYRGEFNDIKKNLNQCIGAVNALVADAALLSRSAVEGRLSTRADASKHHGDFRRIVQGVNDTLDAVIGPLGVAATYVERIARGDIPEPITETYSGDFNAIRNNLNQAIGAVNAMVADVNGLSQAAVEGRLSARADASRHQGDFRRIVQGVNDTLDAVIGPLNVAAAYVDRISRGDIPERITTVYHGEFNTLKDNLNRAIDAVNALVADAAMLSVAALDGQLSTRADSSHHHGDFRRIVQGFNDTLDAVVRPVQEGSHALAVMATGDLTIRMSGEYRGDLALIKESINRVGSSLEEALLRVSEAVRATASASSDIRTSTEQMAAGAHEQTSQTGAVATSMEEMTKTILENARNASVAAGTAKKARVSAEQGGRVVEETVGGMKRIADVVHRSAVTVRELGRSSDQIGEIIGVINDIADQTNLLALNAAIEAARAGEQGRGFAVVADEVRKLAERTTKATKEIAGMIKQIQADTGGAVAAMEEGTREVEQGIRLADRAGSSLREIVSVSQTVTDMVTQIAAASEEQSGASGEIARNIEAISTVTAETSQGTQQIARTAEDLNGMTEQLQQLVRQFKLKDGETGHARTAAVKRSSAPAPVSAVP